MNCPPPSLPMLEGGHIGWLELSFLFYVLCYRFPFKTVKNSQSFQSGTIPLLTLPISTSVSVFQKQPFWLLLYTWIKSFIPNILQRNSGGLCGANVHTHQSTKSLQKLFLPPSKKNPRTPNQLVPELCFSFVAGSQAFRAHLLCEVLLQSKMAFLQGRLMEAEKKHAPVSRHWKHSLMCCNNFKHISLITFPRCTSPPFFHKTRKAVNMLTFLTGSVSNYRQIFWKRLCWMNLSV